MNLDFDLDEQSRFNARCAAIIYNTDKDKVLLFQPRGCDYYMLPGGRIEFGEDSAIAIKREIKEETGFELDFEFIGIQENFLIRHGKNLMQYAFNFEAQYDGPEESFICKDNTSQMFFWIPLKDVENLNLVPTSNKELILSENRIIHSIERDRTVY